jgi:hypothetical protein
MKMTFDPDGTVEGLKQAIEQISTQDGVEGLLIFSCDENGFVPSQIDDTLRAIDLPFIGGIFPKIIFQNHLADKGTIVVGLPDRPQVHLLRDLSDPDADFDEVIDKKVPLVDRTKTMIVLLDGFASRIGALIDSLFNVFGLEFNYIGGGAGSLSMKQKPCLLTNEGLLMDTAAIAMLNLESGIGVAHGWEPIAGPFTVTESDKNIVHSLNWEPAFEVYRKVVEEKSGSVFSEKNFFDIAKYHPFGISRLGSELIVRDPLILRDDGSLVCVGEVPVNSLVDILRGDNESLIRAATNAADAGRMAYEGPQSERTIFFIDCVSRVLCLGDQFDKEIEAVFEPELPMVGALVIGEIANSGRDYLEFYNKTAVVGVMEG